jgi:competence protein ComEA
MSLFPQQPTNPQTYTQYQISQQQTMPQSAVTPHSAASGLLPPNISSTPSRKKRMLVRSGIFLSMVVLAGIFMVIWYTAPSATVSGNASQQNFSSSPSSTNFSNSTATSSSSTSGASGDIQVYIVGAVKHPGVYTLPSDARVYALLQAAGGPLSNANLVAINLAAKLTDGEEVYVTVIGEIPPTYMGGVPGPGPGTGSGTPTSGSTGPLVNINTASADQMRTALHVSSTTATSIVNYRLQHGPYTSIDQLLNVVSKGIYDKIKNEVTI